MTIVDNIKDWYRALPDKKRYLEFFSAFLTIPVLATVLLTNLNNLQNKNTAPVPTPQIPAPVITIIQPSLPPATSPTPTTNPTVTPTPTPTLTPTPTPTATPTPTPVATPSGILE